MQTRYESRRASFKDLDTNTVERRRNAAKTESEEAKKEFLKSLREAAMAEPQVEDIPTHEDLRARKLFARSFMYQDTMITVPGRLAKEWLVALRPEGQRCLAVLQGNSVTLRQRNGAVIDSFVLDPFAVKRSDQVAIFDCVYGYSNRSMKRTVYIFDLLMQKGNDLIFSDFVFRQYILKEHWPFCAVEGVPMLLGSEETPDFERIDFEFATREAIESRYNLDGSSSGLVSDSLMFYHRDSRYQNGLSQEALIFRDNHLSRFAIDSKHDDGFDGGECMEMVLRASLKRLKTENNQVELATWDGIVLHRMPVLDCPGWLKSGLNKKPFLLVRCQVTNSFEFSSFSSSGKPFPHSLNRIVDQIRKRRAALQLDPTGNELFDSPLLTIESILNSIE